MGLLAQLEILAAFGCCFVVLRITCMCAHTHTHITNRHTVYTQHTDTLETHTVEKQSNQGLSPIP